MSLSIQAVHKTYPNGVEALKGLDLNIAPGEVFGLVGPNGAGKSTLLKVIAGLLRAESGTVSFSGENITGAPRKAARHIGLMPDPLGVYTDITAHDYLEFFARVLGIPAAEQPGRIGAVVAELELAPWLDEEVETLSAGWQRRLALGRILLADTPVLLLDEPAAGLDISARKELLEIVRRLAGKKRSIIISSHILPELEDLADRFGIVEEGQWAEVEKGKTFFTRNELLTGIGKTTISIRCSDPEAACALLTEQGAVPCDGGLRIAADGGDEQVAETIARLCAANHQIFEVTRHSSNLSELVLNALGGHNGDEA